MRAVALLLLALFGTGCSLTYFEVGVAVPEPAGLEIGRTTISEVLREFGPPRLIRRQFDGELYTWRRLSGRQRSLTLLPAYVRAFHYSEAASLRDDLSLLFDRQGVLRGFGVRLESAE
jgi:hypothetical protein